MTEFALTVNDGVTTPTPATDGPLIYNGEHSAQAIAHLIDVFRLPRWSALLRSIVDEFQACEDVLFQILAAFDLETAVGEQLDFLGKEAGESRANRTDADYRAAVRARRLVNASDGKPEQLYGVILALFPDALASITEFFPASIVIEITAVLGGVTLETVALLLNQARLGGVQLDLVLVDAATAFLWSDADASDTINGWGSDTDDALGGDYTAVA